MKEVVIIFMGLIAHMQLGTHNTAVLPRVDDHRAVLFIRHQDGSKIYRNLTDKFVKVSGATGHFSKTGIADAPPLKEISGCKAPLPSVENLTETKLVAAYIDFVDGGRLVSARSHTKTVHFKDIQVGDSQWADGHCATCKIEYRADPAGDAISILTEDMKLHTTESLQVKAGDLVIIKNDPTTGVSSPAHFVHFYELLTGCPSGPGPIPVENPSPCGQLPTVCTPKKVLPKNHKSLLNDPSFVVILVSPTVECTNSQWP